jgi:hypothetical protein
LEWPDLRQQLNDQRNSWVHNKEDAVLPLGSSRSVIQIQKSKGKQPIIDAENPDPDLVPICGKCMQAPFS